MASILLEDPRTHARRLAEADTVWAAIRREYGRSSGLRMVATGEPDAAGRLAKDVAIVRRLEGPMGTPSSPLDDWLPPEVPDCATVMDALVRARGTRSQLEVTIPAQTARSLGICGGDRVTLTIHTHGRP